MRISNYDSEINLQDIESLSVMIKAVPFENSFVPAFLIISPDDNYQMDIDEINALMDGVEMAKARLDEIIDYLLRKKIFRNAEEEEKEIDDFGESD
jgi:ankyrin repeat protein